MLRNVIAICTIVCFIFTSLPLFAQPKEYDYGSVANPQTEPDRIQISQEEYDKKIKGANNLLLSGAIVGGVGLGIAAGGTALWATNFSLDENEGGDSTAKAGIVMAITGIAMILTGGGLAIAGGIKKGHVKSKYYTFAPIVDLSSKLYGFNFGVNF